MNMRRTITIENMKSDEYDNGGAKLVINYSVGRSPFGTVLIASSSKGIVHMGFDERDSLARLRTTFPHARIIRKNDAMQKAALSVFRKPTALPRIRLYVQGTPFQHKVWSALLSIPSGALSTYGAIAKRIKAPAAHRAVGSAIGANPIAFLIPCHRVIRASGALGDYHWGTARKKRMIAWESAREHDDTVSQSDASSARVFGPKYPAAGAMLLEA